MPIDVELFEASLNFLIATALNDALTFGLSDNLGGEVIHVSSSLPQEFNLSIANALTVEVQIVGQPGPASPSNFHFHIQFVNNECFFNASSLTLTSQNWSMSAQPVNGYITDIYLLSTETITLQPGLSGSNVTDVQMVYTNATLSNPEVEMLQIGVTIGSNVWALLQPKKPVTGTETLHLSTFTDASAPTPLVATLVQPRTVLDDGTPANLLLRLVNTSAEPVHFARPSVKGGATATAIQFAVDIHSAAAWALCKSDEAKLLKVDAPANWIGDPGGIPGDGQRIWLFRPDYTQITQIPANSAIAFQLTGLQTTLPPGFTNLYVTLQEFPNYGTQTVVTQIEKSPLIYNHGLGSGLLSKGTTGNNQGLTLNGDTTNDLLVVDQIGGGKSAHFKGGVGVSIENDLVVAGDVRITAGTNQGLTLNGNTGTDLMQVNQSGTGKSANFKGGAGVSIENYLDVSGDVRINDHALWFRGGSDINHGIRFGGDKPFAKEVVNGPVTFGFWGGALGSTAGEEKIALSWQYTGNVGIGTTKPLGPLSVGDASVAGSDGYLVLGKKNGSYTRQCRIGFDDVSNFVIGDYGNNNTAGPWQAQFGINWAAPSNSLYIDGSGNVGIGTNTPTQAQLVVNGGVQNPPVATTTMISYFSQQDTPGSLHIFDVETAYNNGYIGPAVSIYATGDIWSGYSFVSSSDERSKIIQGRSDSATDLQTLLGIEITDYIFKDVIKKGSAPQKKVIGQQVEKVFPQAVSRQTDVVPDIYRGASFADGWVALATDLEKGERVRLISDKGEGVYEVLEVAQDKFRTDLVAETDKLFVYGREVNDFLSVDYDAIAMLNVSATQEIKREKDAEVQALRDENAALRARLDQVESFIERLKSSGAICEPDIAEEEEALVNG